MTEYTNRVLSYKQGYKEGIAATQSASCKVERCKHNVDKETEQRAIELWNERVNE